MYFFAKPTTYLFAIFILTCLLAYVYAALQPTTEEKYKLLVSEDCVATFSARWCVPCKQQRLNNNDLVHRGIKVVYVDVDRDSDLFEYVCGGNRTIPHSVVIRNGEVKKHFVGVTHADTLEKAYKDSGK